MARKRTIDPGFFRNESLGECSALSRLLFAGLWCWADREGRLEDRPKRLRAEILPYDQVEGEELIYELLKHGLLARYEVQGVKVLEVLNFTKYQDPHPREAPSNLPAREGFAQGSPKASPRSTQGDTQPQPSPARPSYPSCPSRPSWPSSPQASEGLAGTDSLVVFRSRLAERLGLPKMVEVGKDQDQVLEVFHRQLQVVGEEQLLEECVELAAKSKNGTPASLKWFVGWLERFPLKALNGVAQ